MDHKPMTTHRLLPSLIRYPEFQNATVRPLTPETQNLAAAVLSMRLVGANPSPPMHGLGELPGKSNYLLGRDPQKWRTNVPNYAKVRYRDIYPGVDLVFYGNQGELEYDFIVAPGSDPRTIKLAIQGARRIEVEPDEVRRCCGRGGGGF